MLQALVAILAISILVAMSLRADRAFGNHARLPMQWSLAGSVNWTAPRGIALAFTPVLATVSLAVIVTLTLMLEPRAGQEGFEVPTILTLGSTFIAVHALHLWLIGKSLRRDG